MCHTILCPPVTGEVVSCRNNLRPRISKTRQIHGGTGKDSADPTTGKGGDQYKHHNEIKISVQDEIRWETIVVMDQSLPSVLLII